MNNETKRRSGISVMGSLIVLVKPLFPIMLVSITLGTVGYMFAIMLSVLAAGKLYKIIVPDAVIGGLPAGLMNAGNTGFFACLILIAVLRGILHYGEQYCNHYIAFRLLAIIRHKVFAKLRTLCPAKLEGKKKGDLITLITSDIELLEVFYAHTISPIAIASLVSVIMLIIIGKQTPTAALVAAAGYICVGFIIPIMAGRAGAEPGMAFRKGIGSLSALVLDDLRGIDETILYKDGEKRLKDMSGESVRLSKLQKKLADVEAGQRSMTNLAILGFSFIMLFYMVLRFRAGDVSAVQVIIATVAMMGSFGPVTALSNLSNNLNQTLASGERVLSLLEEDPEVMEVLQGDEIDKTGNIEVNEVTFSYDRELILDGMSMTVPEGKILGIHGASGSGKSTLLKLLMRFWEVDKGSISISDSNINSIRTDSLRDMESYVTQDCAVFHDTIAANIGVGDIHASSEQIVEAAKRASLHEWIMSLPNGYETGIGELGETISGGEKQRIGMARAFLHDSPIMLLDEPTSNLDSLNEGIILKSLKDEIRKTEKTVVFVSHRLSTLGVADDIYHMESRRVS